MNRNKKALTEKELLESWEYWPDSKDRLDFSDDDSIADPTYEEHLPMDSEISEGENLSDEEDQYIFELNKNNDEDKEQTVK